MQRYFVKERCNDIFTLSKEDSYHITKVMRMKVKDQIEVVEEGKEYLCEIVNIEGLVTCKVVSLLPKKKEEKPKVILAQALVKEQKMDYILQKSCELGASKIIPFKVERCTVKLEEKEEKKRLRWQKIVKEASEQSKRNDIPEVTSIKDIRELLKENATHKFICSVNETTKTIKSVLSKVNIGDTILFVIGPEGGFTEQEEVIFQENGFISISFGNRVLRTETAPLFVLSAINYEFMR